MADCAVVGDEFSELTSNDIHSRFYKIMEDFKDIPEDAVMEFLKLFRMLSMTASEDLSKNVLTMSGELHRKFGKKNENFGDIIYSIVCLVKN